MKQVIFELRKLACSEHSGIFDQEWRSAFGVARLNRLPVDHELAERAFEPRHLAFEESEARARHFGRGFEVEPERGGEVGMFLWAEIEAARRAPPRNLDIGF